ncbi:MAG: Mov34/MPN/PAD-1 family protein [Acidimicrobiia bacterium]
MALVTVQVYPYRSDAEIASARLAADGIRSAVHADDEGGLNPGFFSHYGIRLEVDESDLDDAFESLGVERVHLGRSVAEAMFSHAVWAQPNEACGLVAMDEEDSITMVFCLTNTDESAHRFTIDPQEHFECVRYAEERGWRIGGIFHSHTTSEPFPSKTDIEGGGDPDWLHMIVGPVVGHRTVVRAFRIVGAEVGEVSVTVES